MLFILVYIGGAAVYIRHRYYHRDLVKLDVQKVNEIIFAFGTEIVDLILSIYLIVVFVKKLIAVTIDLYDDGSPNESLLSDKQTELLSLVTKYFILSFIATLSTQIASGIWCIYWVGYYFNNEEMQIWSGDFIWPTLIPIDCAINTICLFLIFEQNSKWYNKSCSKCHSLILECFRRSTMAKIRIKYTRATAGTTSISNVELTHSLLGSESFDIGRNDP